MIENDEMRAQEAQRVLDSSIYKEAYRIIEERLVNELAQAELTAERVTTIRNLLVATRKVRQYMEQVVMTGKLVALEDERKSLAARLVAGARSFTS